MTTTPTLDAVIRDPAMIAQPMAGAADGLDELAPICPPRNVIERAPA